MATKVKASYPMISYHPRPRPADVSKRDAAKFYTPGFRVAETDDVERIAEGISRCAWAPSVFRHGYRCKPNWISADWIGLDFDSGEMTLDDAVNAFCDMAHVIGTTESHQVSKNGEAPRDRFRVLLRLAARVDDLMLYEHQLRCAHNKYPIDQACLEAARFFFACKEIVSTNADGFPVDIVEMTDADRHRATAPVRMQHARVKYKVIPPWVVATLRKPWPTSEKNSLCFKIGAALGPHGYSSHDIIRMIHDSPEYAGRTIDAKLSKEIELAVTSGIKRGFRDLEALAHG